MANVILRKANSLKNRIIRWAKHHNAHYFLDPERAFTKRFIDQFSPINKHIVEMGNYYLDKRQSIDNQSVVYSFGILTDVDFDEAISKRFGCRVHMYDPTPISIQFMKNQTNPLFDFHPFGVWTENTTLTFYVPKHGGSASAIANAGNMELEKFEAPCKTISDIMAENKHSHIDVLKMDIEGAALPIMQDLIKHDIYPRQIVAEFERPRNSVNKNIDFFYNLNSVCETFQNKKYSIYSLPRTKAKYYSLELLFVKDN